MSKIALHNDPARTTDVSDLSREDLERAIGFAETSGDQELLERIHGTTSDTREWLAAFCDAHETKHGVVFTLP